MLQKPLLSGFVGHVFLSNEDPKSLVGPIFGRNVGEYAGTGLDGEWVRAGDKASAIVSSGRHPETLPYRLRLYKTTEHANMMCGEDFLEKNVRTMPKRVKKQIYAVLGISDKLGRSDSTVLPNETRSAEPLEPIPEGDERAEQPPENEDDDDAMSEGIDPNEDPASDEDEISTDAERFEPSSAQFRDLKLAHDNAGHPTNADFARLLRRGNCRPEIAAWVL